jgi:hypothetical protein
MLYIVLFPGTLWKDDYYWKMITQLYGMKFLAKRYIDIAHFDAVSKLKTIMKGMLSSIWEAYRKCFSRF